MTRSMNDRQSDEEEALSEVTSADVRQLRRRHREAATDEEVGQILSYPRAHGRKRSGVAAELRTQQFYYPFDGDSAAVQALDKELVVARAPFSDQAEEFRSLRRSIQATVFATTNRPALAVVSAEAGDGRTYMAANLAICFSQLGGRTLLIDANLRRPKLHRLLGTSAEPGLSNLLAGEFSSDPVVQIEGVAGLHFLGAGLTRADPVRLLQGARFSMLLERLVDAFDYVLIDTPSHDSGPDARLIAARAGAALVVGRKGHSRIAEVRKLLSQLQIGPTSVAGVVMNAR